MLNDVFDLNIIKPVKIYEDNNGAIAIGKFGNFTKNSKHIEIQYHFINENYQSGNIDIVKIDTRKNLADLLTKSLDRKKFIEIRKAIRIR